MGGIEELSEILHMNRAVPKKSLDFWGITLQYLASLLRKGGRVIARDGRKVVVADLSVNYLPFSLDLITFNFIKRDRPYYY